MPALTHGRVKNGFNLFPRKIKYAQPKCNKDTKEEAAARKAQGYNQLAEYDPNGNKVCVNAQRGLCCGSAIQPRNLGPGHLFQRYRVPTKSCNRKYASTVVTGRSFAAKRAIARRVAKQMPVKNEKGENTYDSYGNLIVKDCCSLPPATSVVCQELIVLSNDHIFGPNGMYFNVNIDCIEYLTGSNFSPPAFLETTVRQKRNGVVIWSGIVIIWPSTNGGSIGTAHGRRNTGQAAGQWQVGDVILLGQ